MENPKGQGAKASSGYKIGVAILAVAIVVVSVLFYVNVSTLKEEAAVIANEKTILKQEITVTLADLGSLKTGNTQLSQNLVDERAKADSLLTRLNTERKWNASTVNKYKRELKSLRSMVQDYIEQIRVLNEKNAALSAENLQYIEDIKVSSERAEKAEQLSRDLDARVKEAQVLSASHIDVVPCKANDKKLRRVRRAKKLRVDFNLAANAVAVAGEKTVYARILEPNGTPLSSSATNVISFEGNDIPYSASRTIEYANKNMTVSIYYPCTGLSKGDYTVELYVEGNMIGSQKVYRK